jgi:hypothetical protein
VNFIGIIYSIIYGFLHQAYAFFFQRKSREESSGSGSGVEILVNEPYTDGPGGDGQYTYKIYHIGSHLPGKALKGFMVDLFLNTLQQTRFMLSNKSLLISPCQEFQNCSVV